MPEGHTIHRLAAHHHAVLGGSVVAATSPQGRFAAGAARLTGATLAATEAYGKHLLHHYDGGGYDGGAGGGILHVHLGLYGTFADGPGEPPDPVGQIRLRLVGHRPPGSSCEPDPITGTDTSPDLGSDRRHWIDLRGPAACELLTAAEADALRGRLGADPLRTDADPDAAGERVRRSAKPLGALLLDQSIVAGVGLVYATEVLFRAGIAPTTSGRRLTAGQWRLIWADLVDLMRVGVERGRIDTVRAEHLPEAMGRAPRVDRHGGEVYVYRRAGQPCLLCGTTVQRAVLAARNCYWCPTCQRAVARPVTTRPAPASVR
ncbi:zinc finger domain-containing protein [Solwaraspora sp. WMMD406]|uniref:Fpg/Nei family DNA glycosylase n=1 Tax=Solwaraspora sp. WMMD406 TaxID=3016095 RepID=UPI0024179E08|nr:DNA-formamidopyrimidine glycosylase family protein [Solwaraspora sp. WMMD406]MDG4767570.1 zinc finger domain-containing protein [Solwaraspora sp. WMMD406]